MLNEKYTIDFACSDLERQACEAASLPVDKANIREDNVSTHDEDAGVFVNPLSDAGFKILFEKSGVEQNAAGLKDGRLLRDMLNTFFDERIASIVTVRFKNTELFGETVNQRKTVFDIYFVDGTTRDFVVEMQDEQGEFMENKVHNYMCRAHLNALEKGKAFKHSQAQVIGLWLRTFICIKKRNLGEVYLFLLKNLGKLKEVPPQSDNDDFRPLFEIARVANLKQKDKMRYDKERIYATKWQHVVVSALTHNTRKIVENHLREDCLPIERIAKICGLPLDAITAISIPLEHSKAWASVR